MKYAYKTLSLIPGGLRVAGDDHTVKLAEALENEGNALGSEGWELVSVFPTVSGGGSASKLLAVFRRPLGEDATGDEDPDKGNADR